MIKKIIIFSIVAIVLIGGYFLICSKNTEDSTEESTLFNYDIDQIEEIELQNGDTGKLVLVTDKDEITEIIGALNSFRYKTKTSKEPTDGWSFSITVNEETTRIYVNNDSTVEMDDFIYTSSTDGYFKEFIEKWMP